MTVTPDEVLAYVTAGRCPLCGFRLTHMGRAGACPRHDVVTIVTTVRDDFHFAVRHGDVLLCNVYYELSSQAHARLVTEPRLAALVTTYRARHRYWGIACRK